MASFDTVSEVNMQELDNAVNNLKKELNTRFDFKGSNTEVELNKKDKLIKITTTDDMKMNMLREMLISVVTKRSVDSRCLEFGEVEKAGGSMLRREVKIKEGIDKDIINQHVIERHLDDIITLKGYCASDAIPRYNYDLAIMSSHNEAFGRVTIEYMMSGLPVVAYNGGATIEIIENNISGLLYNNIPEMVLKIKSLIYDKKLRSTIGENGKEKAIKTFSEYQYMSNINMFFDEILKTGEK